MDDLSAKLNEMLSDPQTMQQIQSLLGSLGNGAAAPNPPAATAPQQSSTPDLSALAGLLGSMGGSPGNAPAKAPDLSALAGMLGGNNQGQSPDLSALAGLLGNAGKPPAPAASPGGIDSVQLISAVSKIAPLLQRVQQEDDSTRLLYALRPMLSPERQAKLDESLKMLRMMRLLPLLKNTGILSSIF